MCVERAGHGFMSGAQLVTGVMVHVGTVHQRCDVVTQMVGSPVHRGDRIVQFVRDAGAEFTEHGVTGSLHKFCARVPQVVNQDAVFDVQIFCAHEAAGQGLNGEGSQRRRHRRIFSDDQLELFIGQAHHLDRRGGRRREECVFAARQGHQPYQGSRCGMVQQNVTLVGIAVQGNVTVEYQVHSAHGLTLRGQIGMRANLQDGARPQDSFSPGQKVIQYFPFTVVKAKEHRASHGIVGNRAGDSFTFSLVHFIAQQQPRDCTVALRHQRRKGPRHGDDRCQQPRGQGAAHVGVRAAARHHHPFIVLRARVCLQCLEGAVERADLAGDKSQDEARTAARQVCAFGVNAVDVGD